MVDLIKKYKIDEKARNEGIWRDFDVEFIVNKDTGLTERVPGYRVKIAASGCARHKELLAEGYKPYRADIVAGNNLPEGVDEKVAKEATVALFTDWEGIEIDGKPAKCTPANILRLIEEIPEEVKKWAAVANDLQNYNAAALREAEKNLKRASGGQSTGAQKQNG